MFKTDPKISPLYSWIIEPPIMATATDLHPEQEEKQNSTKTIEKIAAWIVILVIIGLLSLNCYLFWYISIYQDRVINTYISQMTPLQKLGNGIEVSQTEQDAYKKWVFFDKAPEGVKYEWQRWLPGRDWNLYSRK